MATIKTLIGNLKSSTYDVYSTNETVVGKWIDGKPLYRKTMQFSGLSSGENVITHGIKDVDLLLVDTNHSFLKVLDKYTNNILLWQLGNSNQSSSNFSQYSTNVVWISNSTVNIYIGSALSSTLISDLMVTFEYTKTTDTATS